MQQDFQAYQQRSDAIKQWYDAAIALGKSEQYLSQIQQVARAFRDPSMPEPISSLALSTMQRDLGIVEQQKMQHLWQRYSLAVEPVRPMMKANAVALAALKDGYPVELIYKILKHDPQCAEIRQRSGEGALQKHISVSVQNAIHKLQQLHQMHGGQMQHQYKQKPGFEL